MLQSPKFMTTFLLCSCRCVFGHLLVCCTLVGQQLEVRSHALWASLLLRRHSLDLDQNLGNLRSERKKKQACPTRSWFRADMNIYKKKLLSNTTRPDKITVLFTVQVGNTVSCSHIHTNTHMRNDKNINFEVNKHSTFVFTELIGKNCRACALN